MHLAKPRPAPLHFCAFVACGTNVICCPAASAKTRCVWSNKWRPRWVGFIAGRTQAEFASCVHKLEFLKWWHLCTSFPPTKDRIKWAAVAPRPWKQWRRRKSMSSLHPSCICRRRRAQSAASVNPRSNCTAPPHRQDIDGCPRLKSTLTCIGIMSLAGECLAWRGGTPTVVSGTANPGSVLLGRG